MVEIHATQTMAKEMSDWKSAHLVAWLIYECIPQGDIHAMLVKNPILGFQLPHVVNHQYIYPRIL